MKNLHRYNFRLSFYNLVYLFTIKHRIVDIIDNNQFIFSNAALTYLDKFRFDIINNTFLREKLLLCLSVCLFVIKNNQILWPISQNFKNKHNMIKKRRNPVYCSWSKITPPPIIFDFCLFFVFMLILG